MLLSLLGFLIGFAILGTAFAEITAAGANSGDFTAIPQIVKDFYSKEVLFQAQPRCKFLQFAKIRREIQAVRSKSIEFVKYGNLAGGGEIDEATTLTTEALAASTIPISVKEQVNAVTLTELLIRTSLHDVLENSTQLLANNLAVVLDKQFRDAVLETTNVIFGNGAANLGAMTSGSVFNSRTVKDAVEVLAINNAPKFEGDYYVCIAHPKQLRQLRDDANWINANTYMGRRQLYRGEVGMYEGVIFIESTNMPHMDNTATEVKYGDGYTPTHACEAVIFGENAYAWAVALDVELRADAVTELGRKRTLGWYGIWGMGLIEEDNVIKILTAATA